MSGDFIYLDYASTAPVRLEVKSATAKFFGRSFGNPSSLHRLGQEALAALDQARVKIQTVVEARSLNEIIFVSSATEANNLIIKGLVFDYLGRFKKIPHLISSEIDHPSVVETMKELERLGQIHLSLIKPDRSGLISWSGIERVIRPNTILISIHLVNSETGVIQEIKKIAEGIGTINQSSEVKIIFHSDVSQAATTERISIGALGLDGLTLSGHKIGGLKGAGALVLNQKIKLVRLLSGSDQEFGRRAGTENVAAVVGLATALELSQNELDQTRPKLDRIRSYLIERLNSTKIDFELNHQLVNSSAKILNIYLPRAEARDLMIFLDQNNVFVSAGMACKARAPIPSPTVYSQFNSSERARRSLRFSFGRSTTKKEIDRTVGLIEVFLNRAAKFNNQR
ncbi:MAG: cysteine desulfurase [Patescibacteria group bacterium]|nr:cysteine desulfurase [Patescibacteria group bacterium]